MMLNPDLNKSLLAELHTETSGKSFIIVFSGLSVNLLSVAFLGCQPRHQIQPSWCLWCCV